MDSTRCFQIWKLNGGSKRPSGSPYQKCRELRFRSVKRDATPWTPARFTWTKMTSAKPSPEGEAVESPGVVSDEPGPDSEPIPDAEQEQASATMFLGGTRNPGSAFLHLRGNTDSHPDAGRHFMLSRNFASTSSAASTRIRPSRGCSISMITYTVMAMTAVKPRM
jgi:hypothetical protein